MEETYITSKKGYDIYQDGPTSFVVKSGGHVVTRAGSVWSCIVYIDELTSA